MKKTIERERNLAKDLEEIFPESEQKLALSKEEKEIPISDLGGEKDFVLFYLDQTWQEMRHLETLRERSTVFIVTVVTAISGFIIQQKYASETKPFTFFVMGLGVFGLLLNLKLFQIHQKSQTRLEYWYAYYARLFPGASRILDLRTMADERNKEEFPVLSDWRHNYFWSTIYVFVIILGFFLFSNFA